MTKNKFFVAGTAAILAAVFIFFGCYLEPLDFVAVTNITGVLTTTAPRNPLNLSGTVTPANATNKTIVWSVKNAGTTGAAITGSTLNTTAAGTVVVTATIAKGTTETSAYTKDFTITVAPADGNSKQTGIPLAVNTWADGSVAENGEQWFMFTATAATQYIHFKWGTIHSMRVGVYNSSNEIISGNTESSNSILTKSYMVTSGQVYYIRVMPGDGDFSTGTYKIAFSASVTAPVE